MIFPSIPQVPEKCYAGPGPGMQANGATASRKCQHFLDEMQPAACTLGSKDDPRPHWRAPEVFFPMRMSPGKTDFNGFSRPRAGKLCRGLFAHARMFDLLAQTFETGLPHHHAAAPFSLTDSLGRAVAVEQAVLLFRLIGPDPMPTQPHLGHAVLLHSFTL